ncbi:MAG: InlB B-repeat-containing protein [Planctomycetota bacterium]|jgi:hypothetical protein
MKQNKLYLILFIIGIALAIFPSKAYCQGDGTALLVQVSPPGAGVVTPGPGVHRFTSDSQVDLSAVANEGYQFVYWLGDTIEPSKQNTLTVLDSPKIIVAVFERSSFAFAIEEQVAALTSQIGGVFGSRPDLSIGSGGGGGGARFDRPDGFQGGEPPDNGDAPEFPVPDDSESAVVTPEPTTSGLFLFGSLMVLLRRKRRQQGQQGTGRQL